MCLYIVHSRVLSSVLLFVVDVLICVPLQESVLAEREREWNGLQTELRGQLEGVKVELEDSRAQCQLLRDASEKVSRLSGV